MTLLTRSGTPDGRRREKVVRKHRMRVRPGVRATRGVSTGLHQVRILTSEDALFRSAQPGLPRLRPAADRAALIALAYLLGLPPAVPPTSWYSFSAACLSWKSTPDFCNVSSVARAPALSPVRAWATAR